MDGLCIAGVRFFDPSLKEVQKFISDVNAQLLELSEGQTENTIPENGLTMRVALIYDAVMSYTSALNNLGIVEGANVTCDSAGNWNFGSAILNVVRNVSTFCTNIKQGNEFSNLGYHYCVNNICLLRDVLVRAYKAGTG